ncbi:MAG: hypothetical protein ACR2I8_05265 [Steroidobacteraceae bacterium]
MSDTGRSTKPQGRKKSAGSRKPPPRWRRYLVQAELELPPPSSERMPADPEDEDDRDVFDDGQPALPWWQTRLAVATLAAACVLLLALTALALRQASIERTSARAATARAEALTLRAFSSERIVRITPNARSWSPGPDEVISWTEPPQLLRFFFPVGSASFRSFALVIDKVDHGRVMLVERMEPDSNRELRLSLNSSTFGPGEYRLRIQGYTWRGERVDVGWVRLVVRAP